MKPRVLGWPLLVALWTGCTAAPAKDIERYLEDARECAELAEQQRTVEIQLMVVQSCMALHGWEIPGD